MVRSLVLDIGVNGQLLGNLFHAVFSDKINEISDLIWRKESTMSDKDVLCTKILTGLFNFHKKVKQYTLLPLLISQN